MKALFAIVISFCLFARIFAATPSCPTNRPILTEIIGAVAGTYTTNAPAGATCVAACPTAAPVAGTAPTGSTNNNCKCSGTTLPYLPSSTNFATATPCHAAPGTACGATTPFKLDGTACNADANSCGTNAGVPSTPTGFNMCTCNTNYAALPDGSGCIATATGVSNANLGTFTWDSTNAAAGGQYYICKDGYVYSSTTKACALPSTTNSITCPTARPYLYPISAFIADFTAAPSSIACVASCPTGTTATTVTGYTPQICLCSGTTWPNLQGATAYSTAACHTAPSTACTASTPLGLDGTSCQTSATCATNAAVATASNGVSQGVSCVCGTGYGALPDGSACVATASAPANSVLTQIQWPYGDISPIYQCKDGYTYSTTTKACAASSSSTVLTASAIVGVISTFLLFA